MKVEVKNLDSVFDRLLQAARKDFDDQFHAKVQERFSMLVNVTPQWSGDMASNWQISLDGSATYREWGNKKKLWHLADARQMGDEEAVSYAIAQSVNVQYTFEDKIWFANATPLTFGTSTVTGDGTTFAVRPVNLIDGRVAMISYLRERFPQ